MPIKKLPTSSGISMLEILISVGVLGLILTFAYKLLFQTRQFTAASDDRLNLRSVARTIESFVDCPNVAKTCTDSQLFNLPKKNGGVLVSSSGQTILGGWTIRAICKGGNRFNVQAARLQANGKFMKDQLTQQSLDWDHPRSNLFTEKNLCPNPALATPAVADGIEVKAGPSCLVNSPSSLPCNPPLPPPCDLGSTSRGLSIDTFGGNDDVEVPNIFGQRWMRYCGTAAGP